MCGWKSEIWLFFSSKQNVKHPLVPWFRYKFDKAIAFDEYFKCVLFRVKQKIKADRFQFSKTIQQFLTLREKLLLRSCFRILINV